MKMVGRIIYNVTFMDDPNFLFFAEGVVFLRPKKIIDEISEGSTFVNRAKGSLYVCFHPNV
jgi:hypothetical protein